MDRTILWDFVSQRGENLIRRWAGKEARLSNVARAKLNVKLDLLERIGFDAALNAAWLAGPIDKKKKIYKLRIYGNVMVRPLLCQGPVDGNLECTLLLGAIEKGDRLQPEGAAMRAAENREVVKQKPRTRRTRHERF